MARAFPAGSDSLVSGRFRVFSRQQYRGSAEKLSQSWAPAERMQEFTRADRLRECASRRSGALLRFDDR